MNTKMLKGISIAVSLLAGMGAASPALASPTGLQSLGVAQNSIDAWTFSCPAAFPNGRATVLDNPIPFAPLNQLQVALGKAPLATSQVTDVGGQGGGEGGTTSPVAVVNGGAGLYVAVFKQTLLGGESYIGDLFCVDLSGVRHNPILTRQINQ
jgi:hypothetical protein